MLRLVLSCVSEPLYTLIVSDHLFMAECLQLPGFVLLLRTLPFQVAVFIVYLLSQPIWLHL